MKCYERDQNNYDVLGVNSYLIRRLPSPLSRYVPSYASVYFLFTFTALLKGMQRTVMHVQRAVLIYLWLHLKVQYRIYKKCALCHNYLPSHNYVCT